MRLKLASVFFAFLAFKCVNSEACNKKCRDYYYNCDPIVETDRPDEVIDCTTQKYKLRCPEFCTVCAPCEMASMEDLNDAISSLEKDLKEDIDDLQSQLDEKDNDNDNDDDGNKQSDSSSSPSNPVQQDLTIASASAPFVNFNGDLTVPVSVLLDGIYNTDATKDNNCYCSSDNERWGTPEVKLAMKGPTKVDTVKLLAMSEIHPAPMDIQWNQANIVKVCDSMSSDPSSCSTCDLVGAVRLGFFNNWKCHDAQGSIIYLSNNYSSGHFVMACEVQVFGSSA